jgi:hypothetical protein
VKKNEKTSIKRSPTTALVHPPAPSVPKKTRARSEVRRPDEHRHDRDVAVGALGLDVPFTMPERLDRDAERADDTLSDLRMPKIPAVRSLRRR